MLVCHLLSGKTEDICEHAGRCEPWLLEMEEQLECVSLLSSWMTLFPWRFSPQTDVLTLFVTICDIMSSWFVLFLAGGKVLREHSMAGSWNEQIWVILSLINNGHVFI